MTFVRGGGRGIDIHAACLHTEPREQRDQREREIESEREEGRELERGRERASERIM